MSSAITPREGEKVLLNVRKSVFVYARQILFFFGMLFVVALVAAFLYKYMVALIFAAALIVFAIGYGFYYFLVWFYDVYIVTNIRLVSISKRGLFRRDYSEVSYADVTDVTYQVKGVFATILQYGNVTIIGPSTIELTSIPDPGERLETLKALVEATKRRM